MTTKRAKTEHLPGQLDIEDFLMVDIHKTNPHDLSVESGPRCEYCFGPMPCEKHSIKIRDYPHEKPLPDNVEVLDTTTSHDLPVEAVLRQAHDAELIEIVVVGIDNLGQEYLLHSTADMAAAMWYVQRAAHILNLRHDVTMIETFGAEGV